MKKKPITKEQIKQMQDLADTGATAREIAAAFDVSEATVRTYVTLHPKTHKSQWEEQFTKEWNEMRALFHKEETNGDNENNYDGDNNNR